MWFAQRGSGPSYKRMMTMKMAVKLAVQATRLRLNTTPLIITTSTHCQYSVVFKFVLSGKANNMSRFVTIPSLNGEIGPTLVSGSEIVPRRCFVWTEIATAQSAWKFRAASVDRFV